MVNKAGIILSSGYLIFTFINKMNVDEIAKQNIQDRKIASESFMTTPAPLNNFLWYVIVKTGNGYMTGYYSNFDSDKKIAFRYIDQNEKLLENFPDDRFVEKLKFFSNGYYSISKKDSDEIYFNDMRFGQAAGWARSDSKFVFSYRLKNIDDNFVIIKRTDLDVSGREAFRSLVKRIKGN